MIMVGPIENLNWAGWFCCWLLVLLLEIEMYTDPRIRALGD